MANKIEVFYTGGGITLAEVYIDETLYAVVSSDAPDFLAIYTHAEDEKYLPEDMLVCSPIEEIPHEYQPLYTEMLQKLKIAL